MRWFKIPIEYFTVHTPPIARRFSLTRQVSLILVATPPCWLGCVLHPLNFWITRMALDSQNERILMIKKKLLNSLLIIYSIIKLSHSISLPLSSPSPVGGENFIWFYSMEAGGTFQVYTYCFYEHYKHYLRSNGRVRSSVSFLTI